MVDDRTTVAVAHERVRRTRRFALPPGERLEEPSPRKPPIPLAVRAAPVEHARLLGYARLNPDRGAQLRLEVCSELAALLPPELARVVRVLSRRPVDQEHVVGLLCVARPHACSSLGASPAGRTQRRSYERTESRSVCRAAMIVSPFGTTRTVPARLERS